MFGLFKRKDLVCGMKEENGIGIEKNGNWFCSDNCVRTFEKSAKNKKSKKSCCR